ncbi:hypothetical protein NEUTE2DRAFT_47915, partial [Neurospora tetrasperma FGSC 2509]
FAPRSHHNGYPFIYYNKFRSAFLNMVTIITLRCLLCQTLAESFAVTGPILVLTYNNTPPTTTLRERCVNLEASDVFSIKCNAAEFNGCEDMLKRA